MDQNQPSTLYTVSNTRVWKTQDDDDSWTALPNTVTDGSTLNTLLNIVAAKSNGNVLTASNLFDLYRSTDGGMTWSKKSIGRIILSLEIDPLDSNVIYVRSSGCFGCAGVIMSTDGVRVTVHGEVSNLGAFRIRI
jgi:hypothetical protein